ncbi:Protein of unknown function [Cotesia congregata]|uniref:Uncharacterized protein n=1 Tax=Cotesia congregata TaxID=51543 RepID=A0A8J2E1J2_COTCN|nr:Protein of unknown function [Cotesia congregata]
MFLDQYFRQTSKPSYLRELFQEDLSVRRSERLAAKKNNILFKFPNFSTTQYESSFVITVIRLWEELPEDIINSSSLEMFDYKLLLMFLSFVSLILKLYFIPYYMSLSFI